MGVKEDEDNLLVFLPQSTGGPSCSISVANSKMWTFGYASHIPPRQAYLSFGLAEF